MKTFDDPDLKTPDDDPDFDDPDEIDSDEIETLSEYAMLLEDTLASCCKVIVRMVAMNKILLKKAYVAEAPDDAP